VNIEVFREYCLSKKGVTESFPFGGDTLVFKVSGKMFAATGVDSDEFSVNLKCDPERANELRDTYSSVLPGYHMNKKHWNTIIFDSGELSDKLLTELIDHSYNLVVQSLPRKERDEIAGLSI
jgi:predicted DNA-binding protein (MmcQ/YjbR family)